MSQNPTVSVVVIFLNCEKYLRAALDSVLAQTCRDWELLLVDDGSTDASTAIAQEYAARWPSTIRYFEHAGHVNRGISASRNVGIQHARGEFVAPLDADDLWVPTKLELQLRMMRQYPRVALLYHPALYWLENGSCRRQPMTQPAGVLPPGGLIPWVLESDHNVPCPSTVLLRRGMVASLGGFEASAPPVFEDQMMWFKTNVHFAVYHVPECVIRYRIHKESCCARAAASELYLGRIKVYTWLVDYLKRGTLPSDQVDLLSDMTQAALLRAHLRAEQFARLGTSAPGLATQLATLKARLEPPLQNGWHQGWNGSPIKGPCLPPEMQAMLCQVRFHQARREYDRLTKDRNYPPTRLR